MKRKFILSMTVYLIMTLPFLTACNPDDDSMIPDTETPSPEPERPDDGGEDNEGDNNNGDEATSRNISIIVGSTSFSATLDDNETARAFVALLPMTINMTEMNGNEKYYYLPQNLSTNSYSPGTIREGDLMLYGSNCVVLFYETFSSGYSYTRLGRIDNPSGLAEAVGRGNVAVTFSR